MNLITAGALGGLGNGMADMGNKIFQATAMKYDNKHDALNRQLWGLLHSSDFNDRFGKVHDEMGHPSPSAPAGVSAAVTPSQPTMPQAMNPMQQMSMNRMTGPVQVDPAQDYVNARALGA